MSAVKQLSLFNFVQRKSTAKQAEATEDPSNQVSEQHQPIIIDAISESEDPSKATNYNQESEQHQLIDVGEDPSKVKGELYGITDDSIDDEDI